MRIRGAKTTQLAICWLLTVMIAPAAARQHVSAEQPDVPATWDFDFDLFQSLLEFHGLQTLNDASGEISQQRQNRFFASPSKSVIVLTGRIGRILDWIQLHGFLSRGGVVLVASSEQSSVDGYFRIDYGPATARDDRNIWQSHRDCLQVTDVDSSSAIIQNISTIVTNRSGWISHLKNSTFLQWSVLARLPRNLRRHSSSDRPVIAIATSRDGGSGRLILMADDSPLSNGMLWHGDNRILLTNVVHELTKDGRNALMFLHNGEANSSRVTELLAREMARRAGDPSSLPAEIPADLSPIPLSELPADVLLEIGNSVAMSVEDSDALNRLLTDRPRNLAERFYRRGILLVVCGIALVIFLLRSHFGRNVTLPWRRLHRRQEPVDTPSSLPDIDYNRAAQTLSRDICRRVTKSEEPADWQVQLQPHGVAWRTLYGQSPAPQVTADLIAEVLSWSSDSKRDTLSCAEFERFGESIYQLKQLYPTENAVRSGRVWT